MVTSSLIMSEFWKKPGRTLFWTVAQALCETCRNKYLSGLLCNLSLLPHKCQAPKIVKNDKWWIIQSHQMFLYSRLSILTAFLVFVPVSFIKIIKDVEAKKGSVR